MKKEVHRYFIHLTTALNKRCLANLLFLILLFVTEAGYSHSLEGLDIQNYSSLFSEFKQCDINLKYRDTTSEISGHGKNIKVNKKDVHIKDGYAHIKVSGKFNELNITEVTLPVEGGNVFPLYRILLLEKVEVVRKLLEARWSVSFEYRGLDSGVDMKAGQVSYSTSLQAGEHISRLRLFANAPELSNTYIECDYLN